MPTDQTAPAFMRGSNPPLDDRAPVTVITAQPAEAVGAEVVAAARTLLGGCLLPGQRPAHTTPGAQESRRGGAPPGIAIDVGATHRMPLI